MLFRNIAGEDSFVSTSNVWLVVAKGTTTFNRQSLFFSTTEYHLRALFFPEATLLGVWSFNLNLLQAYRKVNIGGDWVSKSLVFLFISRYLFTVFYPGKNVDTPTSPLYADKKYTHQNKFKIILPCNNSNKLKYHCFTEWFNKRWVKVKNDIPLTTPVKTPFPLLRTNLKGLLSLSFRQEFTKGL